MSGADWEEVVCLVVVAVCWRRENVSCSSSARIVIARSKGNWPAGFSAQNVAGENGRISGAWKNAAGHGLSARADFLTRGRPTILTTGTLTPFSPTPYLTRCPWAQGMRQVQTAQSVEEVPLPVGAGDEAVAGPMASCRTKKRASWKDNWLSLL